MSAPTLDGAGVDVLPGRPQPAGSGDRVVSAGETLVSIAEETGHFWQTIWNDPANAALKEARADPNVLVPGDRLTIPPLRLGVQACATARVHRFRRKGIPVKVTFDVRADDGTVFKGKPYTLRVGTTVYEGATDDAGRVEHFVAASARTGVLHVELGEEGYPDFAEWTLDIGGLLPIESVAGMQNRLTALGYDAGDPDGVLDDTVRAAIEAFQADEGLEVTGSAGAETIDKLRQLYGY
jgi:hypothetical protein